MNAKCLMTTSWFLYYTNLEQEQTKASHPNTISYLPWTFDLLTLTL